MSDQTAITPTYQTLVTRNEYDPEASPALAYMLKLTRSGRRTQEQALRRILAILGADTDIFSFPWHNLRYAHTQAIRARLAEESAPATANKILSALRSVLKEAWRLGLMSGDDYTLAASVENVKGETLPAGRELSQGEIRALIQACENDPTPAGARDAAVISVLYAAGLRREELVTVTLADYTRETGELVVKGKGNKERKAHILNGASRALNDWLIVRGDTPGALFNPINKGGRVTIAPLTPQAVYNLLVKRAEQAGVSSFSPHDLRRTFISDLLDANADIATVQKMAGHAKIDTTARYDRRPEETKRKAAGLLNVPYTGKK